MIYQAVGMQQLIPFMPTYGNCSYDAGQGKMAYKVPASPPKTLNIHASFKNGGTTTSAATTLTTH